MGAGYTIIEAQGHPALTLKYKGIVDYNKLSTFIITWLLDRKYELTESKHKHKMSCPHGFEIQRDFLGERRLDDFFMHRVFIALHLWDAFEVTAVKHGKKVKLWNCRIEIQFHFDVVCDYAGRWETSQFLERLRYFYCQYVIKKEIIIKHADELYYKLLSLQTKIKKLLEMETPTEF
ncbi:hypothetical protein ACFL3V_04365 [Nanoarchaeota archaeon]